MLQSSFTDDKGYAVRVISSSAVLCVGVFSFFAHARTHKGTTADENYDSFPVIAHIALKDNSSCRLITASHWRTQYLYLDHQATNNLTIVNISDPTQPHVTKEVSRGHIPGEVQAMVGDVGLITSSTTETAPKTVSIVSFSDPQSPKLQRVFANVSGFTQSPNRGLVFIVNDEGLWILQQHPGHDVELEKEYGRHVVYDR